MLTEAEMDESLDSVRRSDRARHGPAVRVGGSERGLATAPKAKW
jgi:hypothetical protein